MMLKKRSTSFEVLLEVSSVCLLRLSADSADRDSNGCRIRQLAEELTPIAIGVATLNEYKHFTLLIK
jgi:hypothetical protein